MPENDSKVRAVQCNLDLAKYWGISTETIKAVVELLKSHPEMPIDEAMRAGFRTSSESLLPPIS